MIESLDVILWDRKVGTLVSSKKGFGREVCFYFDSEYTKSGPDIAPLRAPLSGIVAQRGLPVYPDEGKEFGGLPSFIADSMPDYWGNVVFAEWVKSRGIREKDLSPLDRLAYIGRRGMGALEFVPPVSIDMETPFRVEITELSRLAQLALSEAGNFRAPMSADFMIENLFKVGTSAGGRRPKAVINVNPLTEECFSGQVPSPAPGFLPMIIKFDEHSDVPSTRIEYAYYLMARSAGLPMMPSRLISGARETHFLTERFDRDGNTKVHVQTLAAMNPQSSATYEDLFATAVKLGIRPAELDNLFLQMTMNIACGNIDDHNKNFSFLMNQDGEWHIAPAYDFTFTVDPSAPAYVNRHSLTIGGKHSDITKADLMDMGRRYNIKGAAALIERAKTAAASFGNFAIEAGLPARWIDIINREITSRLKLLQ